jgi:transcriptional regulator with XRE-family HTH domain
MDENGLPSRVQIRAARGLLDWSQDELANRAGIARATVNRAESGGEVSADTLRLLRRTLEKAGAIFLEENGEGQGVRLRKGKRRGKTGDDAD